MITDDELERRIHAAAGPQDVPTPTPGQLDLILERRRRGERGVGLDSSAGRLPWSPRWFAVLPALAAAALLVLVPARLSPPAPATGAGNLLAELPGFGSLPLAAQASGSPTFPTRESTNGRALRPGVWLYTDASPSSMGPEDTLRAYAVERSEWTGRPAWLLLAGMRVGSRQPLYTDSTWVTRRGLDLLAHHAHVDERRGQPVPTYLLAMLQTMDFSRDSAISVPVTRPSGDSVVVLFWLNLRVHGEEIIETPAGRFTCWKVGVHRGRGRATPGIGFYFWISQTERWPVRQGMNELDDLSYGKMNLLLVRVEGEEVPL